VHGIDNSLKVASKLFCWQERGLEGEVHVPGEDLGGDFGIRMQELSIMVIYRRYVKLKALKKWYYSEF
jgi:hypothetical protein